MKPLINSQREDSLFINGQFCCPQRSSDELHAINPATGETIQTLSAATTVDVDSAVVAAKQAFPLWKQTTAEERAAYLRKIAEIMTKRRDELAALSTLNNGKPLFEAEIDIDDAIACYHYYADLISTKPLKADVPLAADDYQAECHLAPMGVVGLIVPWNFPLVTTAWKVAPALAAGCTVVLKPSEVTPVPELMMGEIVQAAKLPKGVFNILIGGAEVGQAIVSHRDIAKISFTGSNLVGEKVMCSAARTNKNISLELGGKSPIIVCEDVDIDEAVDYVMGGIFYNAGQICSATSRLLVHEKIADTFLAKLKLAAENVAIGDGFDKNTVMGAITHEPQYQSILNTIAAGKAEQLTLLTGGEAVDSTGYFIQPTIFTDVPTNSRLWREEIFGPVLCVRTFSEEVEAINQANDSDYGLAATVVSRNHEQAKRIANELNAGHIWINTGQIVFAETSWGGYGKSGIGRELGPWGLSAYQEVKQFIRYGKKNIN